MHMHTYGMCAIEDIEDEMISVDR